MPRATRRMFCAAAGPWVLAGALLGAAATRSAADAFADGFALQQAGELQEARQRYTEATAAGAADADVWYHLGLVETQLGNPGRAVRAYQRALDAEPASAFAYRVRTNLGWALIRSDEVGRGVDTLKKVAEARPDEFAALANVAHALYLHAKNYNRAEGWYQRLADEFRPKPGERPVADLWLREAKQRATIFKIGTGFDIYRGDIVGGEFRGQVYGPSADDKVLEVRTTEGKRVTLRKSEIRSVTTEPKYRGMGRTIRSGTDSRRPLTYGAILPAENLREGQTLLQAGDAAGAERQFATALRKDPDGNVAAYGRAVALHRLKQYAAAARLFEACTSVEETRAKAHYYLVSTYANHLDNLPAALEHALAYVQLPDVPNTKAIEGAAVKIIGQLIDQHAGRQETAWTADAGLDLANGEHRRVLGLAYLTSGKPGPALRHLGAAVELGAGTRRARALSALEVCLAQLEAQGTAAPAVTYYRGYLHFAAGRMAEAREALEGAGADLRSKTLLALVRAHQLDGAGARATLATIQSADLPGPTRRLYDIASAIVDAPRWYEQQRAGRQDEAFTYARVGAVNGLGVYSETDEGDLMPIIAVCKRNGRGNLEVNGNPMFDLFSVISFKEAFDWVENSVDPSFPNQWDTTITFGGLSLYLAKGGDSAGCAIALALCSAVTGQPVLQDVAVTGAIRLDGRVEPVGAVPEKVLGALAQDVRTIVLPEANLEDLGEQDLAVYSRVKFVTVSSVAEARYHAFGASDPATADTYTETEQQFRTGCRYFQLGAYALARQALESARDATPGNYSAQRLLEAIGDADVGAVLPDAIGG